jgi:hypothetical protein
LGLSELGGDLAETRAKSDCTRLICSSRDKLLYRPVQHSTNYWCSRFSDQSFFDGTKAGYGLDDIEDGEMSRRR